MKGTPALVVLLVAGKSVLLLGVVVGDIDFGSLSGRSSSTLRASATVIFGKRPPVVSPGPEAMATNAWGVAIRLIT